MICGGMYVTIYDPPLWMNFLSDRIVKSQVVTGHNTYFRNPIRSFAKVAFGNIPHRHTIDTICSYDSLSTFPLKISCW